MPQNAMEAMQWPRASDLTEVLAAWGVTMTPGSVVTDRKLAQRVRTPFVVDVGLGIPLGREGGGGEEQKGEQGDGQRNRGGVSRISPWHPHRPLLRSAASAPVVPVHNCCTVPHPPWAARFSSPF